MHEDTAGTADLKALRIKQKNRAYRNRSGAIVATSAILRGDVRTAGRSVRTKQTDVTELSPERGPRVTHDPVVANAFLMTVADELHNVVDIWLKSAKPRPRSRHELRECVSQWRTGVGLVAAIVDALFVLEPGRSIDVDDQRTNSRKGAQDRVLLIGRQDHVAKQRRVGPLR